jgi:hypothetical protein
MAFEFKSVTVAVDATLTSLLAGPTTGERTIKSLRFGHINDGSGATDETVDVTFNTQGGGDVYIVKTLAVGIGENIVFGGGAGGDIYLSSPLTSGATADEIKALASTASTIVAFISYIERTV